MDTYMDTKDSGKANQKTSLFAAEKKQENARPADLDEESDKRG